MIAVDTRDSNASGNASVIGVYERGGAISEQYYNGGDQRNVEQTMIVVGGERRLYRIKISYTTRGGKTKFIEKLWNYFDK